MLDLDIEQPDQLLAYLRRKGHLGDEETLIVRSMPGGVSNRTMYVEFRDGRAWVLKQALVKLRVKVDWFGDQRRIHSEALGMRWLKKLAPPGSITSFIFEDHDHHILAMEAIPQPHENWKQMLLKGRIESEHVRLFAHLLSQIHCNAARMRDQLSKTFDEKSFFESMRIEPFYTYTATQVPQSKAFYDQLSGDMRTRRFTLVHADYNPKNILVCHKHCLTSDAGSKLVLLDHEVIHFGDGAFDIGLSMAHLLSKAHHLLDHRATLTQMTMLYWQTYIDAAANEPWLDQFELFAIRHTLGNLLARVAGRSVLEYLSETERQRQRKVVISMMANEPATINELIDRFIKGPPLENLWVE